MHTKFFWCALYFYLATDSHRRGLTCTLTNPNISLSQTAKLRAEIQLLRKHAEEDRTAENNILSQANQQAEMFAKALAAAPAGCTAALGTVVDPRLPIVFGGRGVRSGGVTGVGSGTTGLDYPRPPAVSKPKCNNAVGGKADAAAAAARGGGEKEAALTRVKSLFAALKTVGNGQGGATVVTTASGVPSSRAVGASAVGASAAGASAGGASAGGGDVGGGNDLCAQVFAGAGPKAPTAVCTYAGDVLAMTKNLAPAATEGGTTGRETMPLDDNVRRQVRENKSP